MIETRQIDDIVNRIALNYNPDKIILFGSQGTRMEKYDKVTLTSLGKYLRQLMELNEINFEEIIELSKSFRPLK